eukprot:3463629-Pleurochrysis_carterae.AAC.1
MRATEALGQMRRRPRENAGVLVIGVSIARSLGESFAPRASRTRSTRGRLSASWASRNAGRECSRES